MQGAAPQRKPLNLLPGGAAPAPPEVHAEAGECSVPAPAMPPDALAEAIRRALHAYAARRDGELRQALEDALRALGEVAP